MSDTQGQSASVKEHRDRAESYGAISIAIITISDTRTPDTDRSGQLIRKLSEAAGHQIVGYELVKDEPVQILKSLEAGCDSSAQALLTNGGTGISQRDQTCGPGCWSTGKDLAGFRRIVSYAEFRRDWSRGPAVPGCGWHLQGQSHFTVCLGSSNAVQLAMEKLILPELQHVVAETSPLTLVWDFSVKPYTSPTI